MQWELLTPPDFRKLAKEEKLCILPTGVLERHGEHMPFGTDALVAHKVSVKAAEIEPCVVFPPYYFGQIHEAACYHGAIALSGSLTIQLLEEVCDQIGKNGFTKILIVNGHGGNNDMLRYFQRSISDKKKSYTLYSLLSIPGDLGVDMTEVCKTRPLGHACEWETSLVMAVAPGSVKLEYQKYLEPIETTKRTAHLGTLHSSFAWYGEVPLNTMGCPSQATQEKGELLLEKYAEALAKIIRTVKEDTTIPNLQKSFYDEVESKIL